MTLPAAFILPILCERLKNPSRLADRGYVAKPKLDGQRAQFNVRRVARLLPTAAAACICSGTPAWPGCASSRGRSIQPASTARSCADDARGGIQAVFAERKRPDGAMALVLFDVLHLDGGSVMREPWRDRRKRLEDLVDDG